jgi:hypothetical protein
MGAESFDGQRGLPASASRPRPDAQLMIRTVAAARAAGARADVVRAFARHGPPMPVGAGAKAEGEWSAWAAELARLSLPPDASWSTWTDGLVRTICAGAAAVAASAAAKARLPLPSTFGALRPEGGGCLVPEAAARAITLAQLERVLALAEQLCAAEGWTDARTGAPMDPERLNLYHVTEHLIKPMDPERLNLYHVTEHLIKPATEAARCSLVELLAEGAQPPDVFVSHWRGEPVADFVACLRQYCEDMELDAQTTRFWVCAFALNRTTWRARWRAGWRAGRSCARCCSPTAR